MTARRDQQHHAEIVTQFTKQAITFAHSRSEAGPQSPPPSLG